jgi:hypothetical protein
MQALISDLNGVRNILFLLLVPAFWRILQKALDKRGDVGWTRVVVLVGLGDSYQDVVAEA